MRTILLVDDDEMIRQTLHNYLEAAGHNLLEAGSGTQALLIAELHEGPIDFLVTDIVMPDMDGYELAKLVSLIYPGVRLIFISGYPADTVNISKASDRPSILMKPFHPQDLLAAIHDTGLLVMAGGV